MLLRRLSGLSLAVLALASVPLPTQAATAPVADFTSGQTLGVGLPGVSWDYGFKQGFAGATIGYPTTGVTPVQRIKAGLRGGWRIVQDGDLSLASLAGLEFDPGPIGGRAYMVPDVGLGAAYHFQLWSTKLVIRFNVTLTVDQGQNLNYAMPMPQPSGYYGDSYTPTTPTGNLFQRLTFGPNTMVGLGFTPAENYELTLGGGTIIGLRVRY